MNDFNIFIPFNKKDEDQRLVGGYASSETLDSQGEIVEKDAIARALPGYLGEYDEKEKRYKLGGLREMHQLSAVGKTVKAIIDNKGLYIDGKVVDKNAWEKVKEGVYAGFSIGGKIVKQVGNRIKDLKLSEISLVDRPANPDAMFMMVKADKTGVMHDIQKTVKYMMDEPMIAGREEERPFEEVSEANHILSLANELRYLFERYHHEKRSTKEIEQALNNLKALAIKILNGEDRKKFNKIFEANDFLKAEMHMEGPPAEYTASMILELAKDIRYLISMFEATGKSTI